MKISNFLGIISFVYFVLLVVVDRSDVSIFDNNGYLLLLAFPPLAILMAVSALAAVIIGVTVLMQQRKISVGMFFGAISLLLFYLQFLAVSIQEV